MSKNKKRTMGSVGLAVLLVVGLAVLSGSLRAAPGVEVSFRLSGSYGHLMDGAGDVEEARKGWQSYFFDLNQLDRYTTTFDWEKPKVTTDFRAEIMFRITRNLAVSIGSGYILAKNPGSYTLDYKAAEDYADSHHFEGHEYVEYSQKGTLSAIPITLDAYLFMPIGKNEPLTIFAHIGAGYYFGRLRFNLDMIGTSNSIETAYDELTYQNDSTQDLRMAQKTNSSSWGYHAGLGLDIKLTRFLAIGAEAYGRHVVFQDWEGSMVTQSEYSYKSWSIWGGDSENVYSNTDSTYGNLWTYESAPLNQTRYTTMWVLDEKPEGNSFRNIRKSSINLNSYGISISIKLRFILF